MGRSRKKLHSQKVDLFPKGTLNIIERETWGLSVNPLFGD